MKIHHGRRNRGVRRHCHQDHNWKKSYLNRFNREYWRALVIIQTNRDRLVFGKMIKQRSEHGGDHLGRQARRRRGSDYDVASKLLLDC